MDKTFCALLLAIALTDITYSIARKSLLTTRRFVGLLLLIASYFAVVSKVEPADFGYAPVLLVIAIALWGWEELRRARLNSRK